MIDVRQDSEKCLLALVSFEFFVSVLIGAEFAQISILLPTYSGAKTRESAKQSIENVIPRSRLRKYTH